MRTTKKGKEKGKEKGQEKGTREGTSDRASVRPSDRAPVGDQHSQIQQPVCTCTQKKKAIK